MSTYGIGYPRVQLPGVVNYVRALTYNKQKNNNLERTKNMK